MKKHAILLFALAHLCACAEMKLSVNPPQSSGLPGELQPVVLSVEMDSPEKLTLRVPHSSNLVLRAVERYPVSCTGKNLYLQKRQLVFQGVAPGITVFTNILVEMGSEVVRFPPLKIEVLPVEKIDPPKPAGKDPVREEDPADMPAKTQGRDSP